MHNSPINSTINSTTVGELADATSLNDRARRLLEKEQFLLTPTMW